MTNTKGNAPSADIEAAKRQIENEVAQLYGVQRKTVTTRWMPWIDAMAQGVGLESSADFGVRFYEEVLHDFGRTCGGQGSGSGKTARQSWKDVWIDRLVNARQSWLQATAIAAGTTLDEIAENLQESMVADYLSLFPKGPEALEKLKQEWAEDLQDDALDAEVVVDDLPGQLALGSNVSDQVQIELRQMRDRYEQMRERHTLSDGSLVAMGGLIESLVRDKMTLLEEHVRAATYEEAQQATVRGTHLGLADFLQDEADRTANSIRLPKKI